MRTGARIFCLALLVAFVAIPRARAAGLVSGRYQFETRLSPVCLNGVYPFTVGNMSNCTLAVSMDAKGNVSGQLDMHSLKAPVKGTLLLRKNSLSLRLSSTDGKHPVKISGVLSGTEIVGTATTRFGRAPCALDVSSVGPLTAAFDLMMAVDAKGHIKGMGTVSTCRQQLPVKATGTNKPKATTLSVIGHPFFWQGSGPPGTNGFTASWSARAFGVVRKGTGVAVTPE